MHSPINSHSLLKCEEPIVVAGTIPSWLKGTLLRNGPGIFSVGDTSYQHWFDGMAIMHSFTFKDGESFFINQPSGDCENRLLTCDETQTESRCFYYCVGYR